MVTAAAYVFTLLIAVVAAFQLALAAGAPWGSIAMGGRFPGKFPPVLRALAVVQMALLIAFSCVILVRAGVLMPEWQERSRSVVWAVVAFSALSVVANLATPSKWERIIWAPVAVALLVTSAVVAMN